MTEFFRHIFDPYPFLPKSPEPGWTPALVTLHNLSDIAIWLAYLAIPLVLWYFVRQRRDIPFRRIFLLFGAFIICCGTTHFMGFYTFHTPVYRLDGLIKLLTAGVSWATVFALVPITPIVLSMKSPQELQREIDARRIAEEALQQANDTLEHRVQERTAEIDLLNQRLRRAMSETHHRVKNNLQVVAALVEMQIAEGKEVVPIREMERLGQHVRSLAMLHDLLTHQAKTDDRVAELDMKATLENLAPMLQSTLGGRALPMHLEPIRLPLRPGTTLTILINELVSNAHKHGTGDIEIALTADGETGRLTVCDHGPGFPAGFNARTAAHTGLELVQELAELDLRGNVAFTNDAQGGALVTITFPLHTPQEPHSEIPGGR